MLWKNIYKLPLYKNFTKYKQNHDISLNILMVIYICKGKCENKNQGETIMRNKAKKIVISILSIVMLVGLFTACSNDSEGNNNINPTNVPTQSPVGSNDNNTENKLKGSLTMAGSTSMEKLANALAEAFMIKYSDVTVTAEFVGSSAGIEQVLAGSVDIGNASRGVKDSEKSAGAVENVVAIDGIAVIVDKSNTVTNLAIEQLIDIFTGKINNWNQVGGNNQPIVVVGREAGSGTRGAFEEILEIEDKAVYANEINSTGAVMGKVASTPGAIGYVSIDILNDTVAALKLEGIEPTSENIKAGSYFLSRPFVMATVEEISSQNEIVQAFFEYIYSDEGVQVIQSVGLIPAN